MGGGRGGGRGHRRARDVRIGTSGWRYPPWRGTFYPTGLPQRSELEYASRRVRSIEINGSFYSLQRPESYATWYAETPADFVFAVKGGRFITHAKKLRDCAAPLANFFASGPLALQGKLGPILWQLPPQLGFDASRLEAFLAALPRTTREAAKLAACHDDRLKHPPYLDVDVDRPLRYAIEPRHTTFTDPRFPDVLRAHDVALCIADTAGRWPTIDVVTSRLVYVRLHGSKELYVSGYGPRALDRWAERILGEWKDRDVYVYFDNDVKVRAPFDAINLAARVGQGPPARFPRKALRQREAARGVELSRTEWRGWSYTRASG